MTSAAARRTAGCPGGRRSGNLAAGAQLPRRQADRSRPRERRLADRRDKARLARAFARDGRARVAKPAWSEALWDFQPAARGASARKATARSPPPPGLWLERRLPWRASMS